MSLVMSHLLISQISLTESSGRILVRSSSEKQCFCTYFNMASTGVLWNHDSFTFPELIVNNLVLSRMRINKYESI